MTMPTRLDRVDKSKSHNTEAHILPLHSFRRNLSGNQGRRHRRRRWRRTQGNKRTLERILASRSRWELVEADTGLGDGG